MLVTALDRFDLGTPLEDETFMNTLSKCMTLQKIILILNNLIDSHFQLFLYYTNYLYFKLFDWITLTIFLIISDGLLFFVYDASAIIAKRTAKKNIQDPIEDKV